VVEQRTDADIVRQFRFRIDEEIEEVARAVCEDRDAARPIRRLLLLSELLARAELGA
jgi:hypothetical protein